MFCFHLSDLWMESQVSREGNVKLVAMIANVGFSSMCLFLFSWTAAGGQLMQARQWAENSIAKNSIILPKRGNIVCLMVEMMVNRIVLVMWRYLQHLGHRMHFRWNITIWQIIFLWKWFHCVHYVQSALFSAWLHLASASSNVIGLFEHLIHSRADPVQG